MSGSATFTIVMSSRSMKTPSATATRVHHLPVMPATVSSSRLIVNFLMISQFTILTALPMADDALLENYTGYLLRLAHARAHGAAVERLPDGPHPRVFAVLSTLAATGPLSQQRLAERLRVNRTLMVGVADELERAGYVERHRDPADRRAYALHLTPAGDAARAALGAELGRAEAALTEPLGADERSRLNALLLALVTRQGRYVPASLAERTGFLLSVAHLDARDRANELLRPHGMIVRDVGLMSILDASGPRTQRALAERLSVSATMITQIVDEAEARGLVERRRNPADRRSYLVTLTEAGADKLADGRRAAGQMAAELAESLGADGHTELRALLRKLLGV
jgi:DNA-binding MarR family transcriptional regulator